ncbi:MAG: TonB-dependent receptor [Opitutaceae bacterium]|nr:TonB-dependent receptor [Opitutaceae bacterium]
MNTNKRLALIARWIALALAAFPFARAADTIPAASVSPTGVITGSVSNSATRNLLEGARVEVPALGLSALSDNTGRFVLTGVPAGVHDVVVSYIGLDPTRAQLAIAAGQRTVRDFELTTGIYRLDAFKVTGEREGDALAITAQRNADNVKNIVATDSFGNLPNMSAGEVVMRLPGVAGSPSEEGHFSGFSIRGMDKSLNTITVDGGLLASIGTNRSFEMQSITGTMFEQLELIKGHTPDKGANSLGGTINMKTRSPLNMREKRRLTYSATVRMAPPFFEQVPVREEHRAHPLITLGYQEVFSVFGGERNLGIAANLFYHENSVGAYRITHQYQNTLNTPAFVWSSDVKENYNNRKQRSLNVKTDYRYSFNSKFTLNTTINDNIERFRRSYNTRAYTGNQNTVPNATTSGVIPGFTEKVTQVRAVPASMIDILTNGPNSYVVETYLIDFGAEHEFGPLQLDYNAGFSRNHQASGHHREGGQLALTHRLANVGWIFDRTNSDTYPRLIQTAGPDWSDPNNYRPITNGLVKTSSEQPQNVTQVRGNARYTLPIAVRAHLKAGFSWREQSVKARNASRRWSYIGTSALPVFAASPVPFTFEKAGINLPRWQVSDFMTGGSAGREPVDASLWQEDRFYHEENKFTGNRNATEEVTAGYIMAQGKLGRDGLLGRTGYLTGVRTERTETEGRGWVRARFASTTAQRVADPVGSAQRDYANTFRETKGDYTKSFPSVHLTHDFTSNLKARVSWSTSFGRPAMSNFLPNESVSETNQTVTINNPSIQPQTASNWDATLDYYFEPVGALSVGWFHKTINDYIVSGTIAGIVEGGTDNGYNGEFEGFTRLMSSNAGTATVQGWEFSYQQQFTFLPGLFKGFSGNANYTMIDTHGDFGGRVARKTGEVAGFIPKAANVSLSWRYRGFSTRVLYNFVGEHITSYSAVNPGQNLYRFERETVHLGLAYQLRPTVNLNLDIANLFNEPQRLYSGTPNRAQDVMITFVTVTAGISGRF